MPAPEALFTQAELETFIGPDTLSQQLGTKGKGPPDAARVFMFSQLATGYVLGKVAIAIQPTSLDVWWDAPTTTERDRSQLKLLGMMCCGTLIRYGAQKLEELPDGAREAMSLVDTRATEIARGSARLGANTEPEYTGQSEFHYGNGVGRSPEGSQRWRWRGWG